MTKVTAEVMQLKKENQQFRQLMEIIKGENNTLKNYMTKIEENFRLSQANQSYDTKDSDINRSMMSKPAQIEDPPSSLKL